MLMKTLLLDLVSIVVIVACDFDVISGEIQGYEDLLCFLLRFFCLATIFS